MSKKSKLLWNLMKGNRLLYIGAIISVAISSLLSLVSPLVISFTLDSVLGNKPMQAPAFIIKLINNIGGKSVLVRDLWICGLILVIVTILTGIFQYTKGKWCAEASETMAMNIRNELYDHLQNLSYDYHVKAETGDLIQRCTSDVETIRRFFAVQFIEMGRTVLIFIMALCVMISLNVKMTLISIIVVPFIFSFSYLFFSKIKKSFKLADESEGRMSNTLQENLTGVRVVRAFGRQEFEVERFEDKNTEFRNLSYEIIKLMSTYWSVSDLLIMLQIGAVLVLGVYWAAKGVITLGTLVVFSSYEGMLLFPIRQMGRILTDLGKMTISAGRIQEILDYETEDFISNEKNVKIKGDIEFKNVYFGYEKGKAVLKNVSFKAHQGQTVAILGPTGSGKSSLVHLFQRLYDYDSGSVTIGGCELKEINKKVIRQNIGIVLQEPFLYSKTIKENIGIAKRKVSDEEIREASKTAAIYEDIMDFENGYETAVGERGVTLSGGQKQRIAIARTIIKNYPILIFDDSLSAVDTETDAAIRAELRKKRKDVTTFIISHRISTIKDADLILVLDHGEIVQSGTHDELINENGLYNRVWSIQNSLERDLENEISS